MFIDKYNYTNPGKYPVNEDSLYCGDKMFVVADGLGGHGGGEIASACAVQYIAENYTSAQGISDIISGANSAVCGLNNGSRSTVAAAFIENGYLFYTNVGDSRVYIFRNGKILCRTKDHSVCQASVDAGTMREDEIRGHEDRSRLLKVLGETDKLKVSVYDPLPLRDGDAFLICSDGLWDYVYETEMEIDLLKSDSAKSWADYMLRRHLKRSRCEGDNFTLICGIVHKETDDIPATAMPIPPVEIIPNGPGAVNPTVGGAGEAVLPAKKDHRGLIGFIIGVIVCAALLVGGFFIYKSLSGKKEDSSNPDLGSFTSDTSNSGTSGFGGTDSSSSGNSSGTSENSRPDSSNSPDVSGETSEIGDTSGNEENSNTSGDEENSDTSGDEENSDTSGDEENSDTSGNEENSDTSGNEENSDTSGGEENSDTSSGGGISPFPPFFGSGS